MSIVLEGKIKYRKEKKWKVQYCILLQVLENKGVLELYIVKDPADFHLAHHQQQYPSNENNIGAANLLPRLEKKLSISSTCTNSSESACSIITSMASIGSNLDPNGVNLKPLTFIEPVAIGSHGSPSRLYTSHAPWSQMVRESPPGGPDYIPGIDRICTQSSQLLPTCRPIDTIHGFESGKHVDNEGSVIVLIGQKSVHCMAMNNLDEMFNWAHILDRILKDTDSYFHVKLEKTSESSRFSRYTHGSLHVQPGRLCFIAEPSQGNKFICSWSLNDIQSFDFDQTGFKITANKASGKGRGTHHFTVDIAKFDEFRSAWTRMKETFQNRKTPSAPLNVPLKGLGSLPGFPGTQRLRGTSDGPLILKLPEAMRPNRKEVSNCQQRPRYMSDVGSTLSRGSANNTRNYLTITPPRIIDHSNKASETRAVQGAMNTVTSGTPPTSSNSANRFCSEGIFATDEDFEELEQNPTASNSGSKSYTADENRRLFPNSLQGVNLRSCPSHQRYSIDTTASSGYSDTARSLLDHTSNSCVMNDQLGHLCVNCFLINDNPSTIPQIRHSAPARSFDDSYICRGIDPWSNNDNGNDQSSLSEEKHQYYYRRSNSVSIRYQGSWTKENILGQSAKYNPSQLIGALDKVPVGPASTDCTGKGSSLLSHTGSLRRSFSDSELRRMPQHNHNTSQSSGSYTMKDNRVLWKNGCSQCQASGRKSIATNMLSQFAGGDSRPRKVSPPSVGATLDDIREEAPTTPGAEATARNLSVPKLSDSHSSSGFKKSPVPHTYVNFVKNANSYSQAHQRIPNTSNSLSSSLGGTHTYTNLLQNGFHVPPRICIPGMENTSLPEEVLNPRRNYALMNFSRSHTVKSSHPSHSLSDRNNAVRPSTDISSPCSGMSGHVNYTDIVPPSSIQSMEPARGQESTIPGHVNTNYITVVMNPDSNGLNSTFRNPSHTRASFSSRTMSSAHHNSFAHPSSVSSGYESVGVPTMTPQLNYASIDGGRTQIFSLLVMENDQASLSQNEASCQPKSRNEEGSRNVLSKLSIFSRSTRR